MTTTTAAIHIKRARTALTDSGVASTPSVHSLQHADVQANIARAITLDTLAAAVAAEVDDPADVPCGRCTAVCRPCGITHDHGLAYRDDVLAWAREHADACTALPHPVA